VSLLQPPPTSRLLTIFPNCSHSFIAIHSKTVSIARRWSCSCAFPPPTSAGLAIISRSARVFECVPCTKTAQPAGVVSAQSERISSLRHCRLCLIPLSRLRINILFLEAGISSSSTHCVILFLRGAWVVLLPLLVVQFISLTRHEIHESEKPHRTE
jgi:hypothetical protein